MARRHRRKRRGRRGMVLTSMNYARFMLKLSETKFDARESSDTNIDDAGITILNLNDIAQGIDTNERIGNQLYMQSFFWKSFIQVDGTNESYHYRLILFSPKSADNSASPISTITSLADFDTFNIYKDVSGSTTNGGPDASLTKVIKKRWKPYKTVQYSGTGATTLTKGKLSLAIACSKPAADAGTIDLNFSYRVFYKDP